MQKQPTSAREGQEGAALYSPSVLRFYDWFVLGLSNRLWWKCPTAQIVDFYNQHISANHLDIGVGTGYFLDRCTFPAAQPQIMLADLNENSLRSAAGRISRYQPRTSQINVLEDWQLDDGPFASIGLNYLIHCLPGPMARKAAIFKPIAAHLAPGGVAFGTTILGQGVPKNALARLFLNIYNKKGIFGNLDDSREQLDQMLGQHFSQHEVRVVGCVAFFWGKKEALAPVPARRGGGVG